MGSRAVLHLIHRTHSPAASDSKSACVTSAGGAEKLHQPTSPATTARVDPFFLFTRSPESGDVLQGQLLAPVSDLPRDDWWSDKHSARDLYNELPLTEVIGSPTLLYTVRGRQAVSIVVKQYE